LDNALRVQLVALETMLHDMGEVAVAVSGGVDSLTLATLAHRTVGTRSHMFHAVSPAVPAEASARVRKAAQCQGWRLTVFDAGEFDQPQYRSNPLDRCFYCKRSLYAAIRARTTVQLLSGTNRDDLGEFRPGLAAAQEHGVRHPFVEVAIDKAAVRAIARRLGLAEFAELPAAPCLASRVETGLAIEPETLLRIHAAEQAVARLLAPRTVRCRVRARGIVIELDAPSLARLTPELEAQLAAHVARLFAPAAAVSFAPYRSGSAFVPVNHER
jgi:pyridinium-3,5-biscarboxylic acid mononucleotide sulfurtransferase